MAALRGHVDPSGRLVGDQLRRRAGQGEGDHHALAHPARELEGIGSGSSGVSCPILAPELAWRQGVDRSAASLGMRLELPALTADTRGAPSVESLRKYLPPLIVAVMKAAAQALLHRGDAVASQWCQVRRVEMPRDEGEVVSLGGLVERSIERAVFDGEVGRREFIRGWAPPRRLRHSPRSSPWKWPRRSRRTKSVISREGSQDWLHPDHLCHPDHHGRAHGLLPEAGAQHPGRQGFGAGR
jgi:hypothetical protein